MNRRTILNALAGTAAALILLICVCWWLASLAPTWYAPPDASDKAIQTLGATAEYRLLEEFQKIRPAEEVWRLRIPEEAINAWLATRLPAWLEGRGATWPEDLGTPQVRITPSGIVLAAPSVALGGRMATLRISPEIHEDQLHCNMNWGVGRLPLEFPLSFAGSMISLDEVARIGFLAQLTNGEAMPAEVPLVDRRVVSLHDLQLDASAAILQASTALKP